MCVCVHFHKCILKATSPVTVSGVFRKVPGVSKIPWKTYRTFPAVAPFCWSTLHILLHNWLWRLAFQPYPTNLYAPWRRKNIQQLQFPKQRYLALQHVITYFPFSYHWITVERRRSCVCAKGWLQGEIFSHLNMDWIRSTWAPKMWEARPVSRIFFTLSLSFMKQVCGKKKEARFLLPFLENFYSSFLQTIA